MSSFAKGLAKEMPSPNELKKGSYKSGGKAKEEEGDGEDEAMGFAAELREAIADGDDEAIVAAFRGLKAKC